MKKLYAFFTLVLLPIMAFAWSFDMVEENPVLQGEDYNLKLTKNYNFFAGYYNGEEMVDATGNRVSGDGCFSLAPDAASFKLNGFAAYQVNSPVCMKNFYVQIGTAAINLRAGVGKTGLHNYGSGSRFFAIADVKAGQVIVCQWGYSSGTPVVQPGTAISGATACEWTDITDEVHEAQAAETDPDTGEPNTADTFSYWKVETDGYFVIEMQRNTSIQGLQIWADANAREFVSSPTFSLTRVDFSTRYGDIADGESSEGNAVTTWYSLDGSDPIFLKETDEVESEETVYTYDDEGNVVGEEIVYTYKKVLDPLEEGIFGEVQYFSEDGIIIDETSDEDGDGYVTLKIASVSETGNAFSDIVTYNIAINEIYLNEPTLTLVGLNGLERVYQIGWTNNTLCHEEFGFSANCDGDQYDGLQLGDYVTASDNIVVTVTVNGYHDGVYTLTEVLNKGTEMFRKNKENDEAGLHDWNFVLTDETIKKKIRGEEVAYCYVEGAEDVHYSAEEYENGQSEDGTVDLSGATLVYADYGWDWDAGNLRATFRVLKEQLEDQTWVAIEGGNDLNDNGFGYTDDVLNIIHRDGLSVSCPPNANNNSTILQYIGKMDGDQSELGIYFMARPTLTFDRNAAEYGDYVLIYQGQGGSNYTNSRWPSVHEVPSNELLSVQLANGGIHVFYIDVYTSEKSDDYEDPYVVGISDVKSNPVNRGIVYSIDGRIVNKNADIKSLQKGMYILNGKKFIVK